MTLILMQVVPWLDMSYDLGMDFTSEAMQIHGGMGYAEESAVSRYFVDARVLSIFEGAEEVLALKVVARELIETA